jgi:hypothetical protein
MHLVQVFIIYWVIEFYLVILLYFKTWTELTLIILYSLYYLNRQCRKINSMLYSLYCTTTNPVVCDLYINIIVNNSLIVQVPTKNLYNTFGYLTKVTFIAEVKEWKKNSRIAKVCLHKTWQCDLHKISGYTHTLTS